MNFTSKISILFICIFLFSSCATYKLHLAHSEDNWEATTVPSSSQNVEHTVFLIGDAGGANGEEPTPGLSILKKHLEKAGPNSHVIFLGDNLYPVGMPTKHDDDRQLADYRMDAQLKAVENFKGKALFIPGNHDWYKYGVKGLRRQEKYIEKQLNAGIEDEDDWESHFYPKPGCGDPQLIEVNDKLVILLLDTNWYLQDWDKYPRINSDCQINSREAFERAYLALIQKNKSKNILVALHHPIMSNGSHGGHYAARDHIFPYKNVFLPVVGTVINGLRASIGTRQDITHSIYQRMIRSLIAPATQNGEFIFASGHEHNLQYFDLSNDPSDRQHYIVSGSGSKKTPLVGGNRAKFGYGNYGFSKLDYYEDGSVWLEAWSFDESQNEKMVYRTKVKDALAKEEAKEEMVHDFPNYTSNKPSFSATPITIPLKPVGKFHNTVLGRHYRDIYLEKYDFKTLDLASFNNGVKVLQKGGGMQTNSLRLQAPDEHQYVMRSLTKDATRGVPYPFNRMNFVNALMNDNFLSTHPFGALAVPTLADASNVYHANPSIRYVPKQPTLGVYNDIFGDEVYIVEERAGGKWPELKSFGQSEKKLISTLDVAAKVRKNHKHHIDQKWVARSRLFDLVIGDWDRHDDQWRWTRFEDEDGHDIYRPIPRDRDQAFSQYDGLLIKLLRPFNPLLKQLSEYNEEITNMRWIANNTRHFDHSFLSELTLEDWLEEAKLIKANLSDEIIDEAFTYFPKKAYELSGERIKEVLRYRRDHIEEIAVAFYQQVSKKVAIVGTDHRELFEIKRASDKITTVEVIALSEKGKRKKQLYKRSFINADTKEIILYGLEDDDEFIIDGSVNKSIKMRIVGGEGDDKIIDRSKVSGPSKHSLIYDSIGDNVFELGSEGKNKTNNIIARNFYDRKGAQFDESFNIPFPILSVNADDGFLLGFNLSRTVGGFFKTPYARRQHFSADYAFATQGLKLAYEGEFIQTNGKWDFVVDAKAQNNRYAFNYYGFGNESVKTTDDLDFNRVRQTHYYLDAGWQRRFAVNYGRLSIRPLIQFNEVDNTVDRFISSDDSDVNDDIFDGKIHVGGLAGFEYENLDDLASPKNGINISAHYSYQLDAENTSEDFHKIDVNLTRYVSQRRRLPLTFATKFSFSYINGDFPFYFAPTLGQHNSLRGYRPERFRGNAAFYHSNDLRWSIFKSANVSVPFTFGIFGAFDYGRVWEKDDTSSKWHNSYGGGFWIAPLDFIVLSFGLHQSEENTLFRFRAGHDF